MSRKKTLAQRQQDVQQQIALALVKAIQAHAMAGTYVVVTGYHVKVDGRTFYVSVTESEANP